MENTICALLALAIVVPVFVIGMCVLFIKLSDVWAQRSGVLQGCVPSTTGSASAATQEAQAVNSQPASMASPHLSGEEAEDETGVDNSVSGSERAKMLEAIRILHPLMVKYNWEQLIIKSSDTPSAAGVSGGS